MLTTHHATAQADQVTSAHAHVQAPSQRPTQKPVPIQAQIAAKSHPITSNLSTLEFFTFPHPTQFTSRSKSRASF